MFRPQQRGKLVHPIAHWPANPADVSWRTVTRCSCCNGSHFRQVPAARRFRRHQAVGAAQAVRGDTRGGPRDRRSHAESSTDMRRTGRVEKCLEALSRQLGQGSRDFPSEAVRCSLATGSGRRFPGSAVKRGYPIDNRKAVEQQGEDAPARSGNGTVWPFEHGIRWLWSG